MKKFTIRLLVTMLTMVMILSSVGCKKGKGDSDSTDSSDTPTPPPAPPAISIEVSTDNTWLYRVGDSAKLSVKITNSDKGYTWSITDKDGKKFDKEYAYVDDDVLVYSESVKLTTQIYVNAISKEDPTKSGNAIVTLRAPIKDGDNQGLTSEMIEEISNESITAKGILTDNYRDFNNSVNDWSSEYEMEVRMEKGKWSGKWSTTENSEDGDRNFMVETYFEGDTVTSKGTTGNSVEQVYIDRNNNVKHRQLEDFSYYPLLWSERHFWNHLNDLDIMKFEYIPEDDVYKFTINQNNEEDAWLGTYIAFSLTPMLSDTLYEIYLVVDHEAEKITHLIAKTEIVKYGEREDGSCEAMSWTEVDIQFSDIGTTTVEEPTPYDAPENAEMLQNAFDTMKNQKNYTFNSKKEVKSKPNTDDGEYTPEYESAAVMSANLMADKPTFPTNNQSAKGTVGRVGYVTEDAIFLSQTNEYAYTMDTRPFHTEYEGFRQINNETYEHFKCYLQDDIYAGYEGDEIKNGNISDELPEFNLSANVFDFVNVIPGKVNRYMFELRDSAITREVARQLVYNDWKDAVSSTLGTMQIIVDQNGKIESVSFYYEEGPYFGKMTTTYSKFGETTMYEDLFGSTYKPRVLPTLGETTTKFYHKYDTETDKNGDVNTQIVLNDLYTDAELKNIPSLDIIREIFGDKIYGPFYQERTDDEAYKGYLRIGSEYNNYDEDGYEIYCYDKIEEKIKEVMEKNGYEFNPNQSGTRGSDNYTTFIKDNIMVVFWNNRTKNVDINIYKIGQWQLNK